MATEGYLVPVIEIPVAVDVDVVVSVVEELLMLV
jgi:hypothetical protein